MQPIKSILHYGSDQPLPAQHPLQAGPLTLFYEAGDLRYIRFGATEVLRRLYWTVRDSNWGTPPLTLSNVVIEQNTDSFSIHYDAICQQAEIDFRAQATIQGSAAGEIRFEFSGIAHSNFYRNRLGFCVLHPMGVAGNHARIEHVDGQVEAQQIPLHIASQLVINSEIKPVIPFNEMRALTHEITPGVWAEVRFAGDIFEMEDQRNWTDASFKTYCTPLRLPFPVEVKEGTTISQAITLKLLHEGKSPAKTKLTRPGVGQRPVTVHIDSSARQPLPQIGLGVASHDQPLSQRELERLRQLSLSHLRVDLQLAEPDYLARLQRATAEVNALGIQLEVALHLTDDAEAQLEKLLLALKDIQPPVAAWLIFYQNEKVTSSPWIKLARTKLAAYADAVPICGGTNIYFTELNSRRLDAVALATLDAVAYSINPQVHAFDNKSLVETLAAQAATATSARQFCGNLPLRVTPITLQPRFNPNATGPEPATKLGELPSQVDVRQMSLFAAAWTLGSIKQLAQSGEVASVTYYETTGWRGVMEQKGGSHLPDKFHSIAGAVFPLYHVFADINDFGGSLLTSHSSDTLRVEALMLSKEGKTRLILANMSHEPQRIQVNMIQANSLSEAVVRVRILDERNVLQAMRSPRLFQQRTGTQRVTKHKKLNIELLPYGLARIDGKL